MKAICDGFSCAGFVYFAFASICISIFRFFTAGIFKNAPKKSTRSIVDLFVNAIFFKEKSYLDITKNIVLPTVGINKRFWIKLNNCNITEGPMRLQYC